MSYPEAVIVQRDDYLHLTPATIALFGRVYHLQGTVWLKHHENPRFFVELVGRITINQHKYSVRHFIDQASSDSVRTYCGMTLAVPSAVYREMAEPIQTVLEHYRDALLKRRAEMLHK